LKEDGMSDDLLSAQRIKTNSWDELDSQRDIAFKVMYFFIVFIIATFGLLYAYF